ncbi:type II secretion system protein [Stutzerimonas stutzeri]|uniref:type II secretion system protein n=1 Tax=Stutzerimonas stutzeri TaxID=316 RepID=UPI00035FBC00|nr:type II secretion system protein [Stutzerimonas stutzeri]
MKKQQSGFTLIELIMVIVILGILAAFALPRFADFSGDARAASIRGLEGTLKSAAAIAHAAQLAKASTLGADVTMEGVAIKMVNGYPQALADGIGAAANINSEDYTATTEGDSAGGAAIIYQLKAKPSGTCQVTYTAAKAASDNTGPVTAAPKIVANVTSC